MSAIVGAWEPATALGETHALALDRAVAAGVEEHLDAAAADADRLRQVFNADAAEQARLLGERTSERLIGWARALTLAEQAIPGCDAGARSPVIAIARTLRQRGDYPPELTAWIRRVSSNRFLPYGSLLDRLGKG